MLSAIQTVLVKMAAMLRIFTKKNLPKNVYVNHIRTDENNRFFVRNGVISIFSRRVCTRLNMIDRRWVYFFSNNQCP